MSAASVFATWSKTAAGRRSAAENMAPVSVRSSQVQVLATVVTVLKENCEDSEVFG